MEYKPNPELERLKAEKEKNEKEIEQLNHKITRLENRQRLALCEAQHQTTMLVLSASLRSGQGSATLALLRNYPGELALGHDFSNHSVPTRLKTIITQRRFYGIQTQSRACKAQSRKREK